ncbi:unnamed protein product [Ilex paraguariensis]|uniref:GYF domain-containing protein n=1 Tax=Ilex paraguariensis TaxID=185542 RepID=A0ABC8UET8_9AQUA
MADKTAFDSRPNQISNGVQGSDNSVLLSPQWLLPKAGENKTGLVMGENHFSLSAGYASRSDVMKSLGTGEDMHDTQKKKDVFRPSMFDMDSGHGDRWRDEERNTNSSIRKGRWREGGGRELGDNRKMDRWTDSSERHFGEARRAPLERWTDSSNRESIFDQRRESKWNTRWGPDDKETESLRETLTDSNKDTDMPLGKELVHLSHRGKDGREGDNHRPWRSNTTYSRGKVEPPHHQTFTPSKQIPTFVQGSGHGENALPTFSLSQGRVSFGGSSVNNTVHSQSLGSFSEVGENGHGEPSPLRYSRTKLLDVYRMTNMESCGKLLDGVVEVSSFTQEESLEPLAFCAPTSEELVILKGIDSGDIVSSGAPQVIKDGSVGRNSTDFVQLRQNKLGSREDFPLAVSDCNDETMEDSKHGYSNYSEGWSSEKQLYSNGRNAKIETMQDHQKFSDYKLNAEAPREEGAYRRNDEVPLNRESSMLGNSSLHAGATRRSTSMGEHNSYDWRDIPNDLRSRTSDIGWSPSNEWEGSLTDLSYNKDGPKWQISDDPVIRRQSSAVLDREPDSRKLLQPSPEELLLYYKDPHGEVQGPFAGIDIIGWFEAGYFGIDLQVRLANTPHDSPFSSLGDVMPHLRAKARPPPGFGAPKHNEITNATSGLNTSIGKLNIGSSGSDVLKNEPRYRQSSTKEAENRFLESLMSANLGSEPFGKFALSEGMQGYLGNNGSIIPPLGTESGDNLYLLANRMTLERQRSLPNPYPYWPGKDAASVPESEIIRDSSMPHPRLSLSIAEHPLCQNTDLMSIIQGFPDRSTSGGNKEVDGWSNFSVQGGLEPLKEKVDIHHGQRLPPQTAYGIQQQRLQPQNQPSLPNLLAQAIDNSSGTLTLEKPLSSGLLQDPQLFSLLQKQYLMQLHSQAPVPSQQLSPLDKLLLLKQQQKQEEEQQLLRQQQQLLSQVLSEHTSHQRFGDPSYGELQAAGLSKENVSIDHPRFQQSHELFQIGSETPGPNMQDERSTVKLSPSVPQYVSHNVSEISSIDLPPQMFGNIIHQKSLGDGLSAQIDETLQKGSLLASAEMDAFLQSQVVDKFQQAQVSQNNLRTVEPVMATTSEASANFSSLEYLGKTVAVPSMGTSENQVLMPEQQVNDLKVPPAKVVVEPQVEQDHCVDEPSVVKEVKTVETPEVRKASEKKSKKQKSSKAQDQEAKGASKMKQSNQSETEGTHLAQTKSEADTAPGDIFYGAAQLETRKTNVDSEGGKGSLSAQVVRDEVGTKSDSGQAGYVSQRGMQVQRAWKPAPGFKPMSLLEIQQEEQRMSQTQMTVSEFSTSLGSMGLSSPWSGVVADSDQGKPESPLNQKSKKSQLHDLLAEETSVKSSEREREALESFSSLPPLPVTSLVSDSIDDNFIEAKDTKRNRKKSAKAKGVGSKVSMPIISAVVSLGSSPNEKGKTSRQVQQEHEELAAVPSSPSLGDFVVWKGELSNPSPAPAWLTDSGKLPKPTSLRDILKEQQKKISSSQHQIPVPSPQKSLPTQSSRGSGPSWSGSSPATAASSNQFISQVASQSKNRVDDDLFWGPLDQPKQQAKQSDFPQLVNQGSWGTKNSPAKGIPGQSLSRQKSVGGRPVECSLSSSPASVHSSLKGKKDALTKHSEAMDFRDWCESECIRLIGTKDTSFLDFCSKQSRSEAEVLLTENLGLFDPDHEFIDKFLSYKDFLPDDVLEIAFQSRNDSKVNGLGSGDVTYDNVDVGGSDQGNATVPDGSTKGGGKKKGKKGKKVSSSVLGFNVVSNRIMMGEIQALED